MPSYWETNNQLELDRKAANDAAYLASLPFDYPTSGTVTKAITESRTASNGTATIDDELSFSARASKSWYISANLLFSGATGDPGITFNVSGEHASILFSGTAIVNSNSGSTYIVMDGTNITFTSSSLVYNVQINGMATVGAASSAPDALGVYWDQSGTTSLSLVAGSNLNYRLAT